MSNVLVSKNKVRELMAINGIQTQTELADKIGITKNQLSVILSSKFDPIKSNVNILCKILNANIEDIVVEKDNKALQQLNLFDDESDIENIEVDIFNIIQRGCDNIEYIDISTVIPNRTYNVVELFAGAGGLALGLEEAGFNTVALNEKDSHCCQTLRNNRPTWNIIEEDIIKATEKGIKSYIPDMDIDVLSGGYPCQAFSYAGNKLGLEDIRGTMFYYYAETLKELRPKVFLAENVRGLISHDNGKTIKTMMDVFKEIGYNVEYQLLNAKNYGVSQKRERMVMIGIRNDIENVKHYYPKPFDYIPTLRDALRDVPQSIGQKYPPKKKEILDLVPPGGYWRDLPEDIAREYMGISYFSTGGRTGMARRISWDEPSLTLTCSPAQKQTERCHPDETRPFTVREYARIQSFPDNWLFSGSMGEQYKQIGNAVPVKLAKAIGLSLINILNNVE